MTRGGKTSTHRVEVDPAKTSDAAACLAVRAGAAKGRVFRLTGGPYVIGRDPDADIRLVDRGVSRAHAKIVRASDGIVNLLDLGSHNGTFVNRRRIELVALFDGDRVQVGPVARLEFLHSDPLDGEDHPLSPRELEVARLVASGLTTAAIAKALGISPRTITTHLDHIYTRLGFHSRARLARYITEAGLLHSPEDE